MLGMLNEYFFSLSSVDGCVRSYDIRMGKLRIDHLARTCHRAVKREEHRANVSRLFPTLNAIHICRAMRLSLAFS